MRRLCVALGLLVVTAPLWAQVSKTFTWTNATTYKDGSTLPASQIRETRILVAPIAGGTPTIVEVASGSVTQHASLPLFSAGQWFARARHVSAGGVEGDLSAEISFTVGVCQANPMACTPNPPTGLTVL